MTAPGMTKAGVSASAHLQEPRRPASDLAYQFRVLLPVALCVGALLVLSFVLVWMPMHRQLASDPNPIIQALLAAQLFRIEVWLLPLLLLSGSLAAVVALFHARRVTRPIKRLREGLARLAVGAPEPLTFQPNDQFRELEAPFAGVVNRMEQLTKGNLEMLRFLRRNLEGLSQRAETLSGADLRESVAVLLRDVDAEIKKLQMRA